MSQTEHSSVARVKTVLESLGLKPEIRKLSDTARTAIDAANALGVEVGQIASSIVFGFDHDGQRVPVLVITSGRHRVDTDLVAKTAGLNKLHRVDADFVRHWSGFAIGGVSPIGWLHGDRIQQPLTFIDTALEDYHEVWAAAGHTHVVFQTTFTQLVSATGGTALAVSAN